MKSQCDNCGWVGVPKIELYEVKGLSERLTPGCVTPSGECHKCGALCYLIKPRRKHVAHAVNAGGWQVKIPSGIKSAKKWFTVCDCYLNPLTGNAEETAIKIAQLLNGD